MDRNNNIAEDCDVSDLPLWRDDDAHQVLTTVLENQQVSEEIFAQLVAAYRSHAHKQRTRGLIAEFDDIFQSLTGDD